MITNTKHNQKFVFIPIILILLILTFYESLEAQVSQDEYSTNCRAVFIDFQKGSVNGLMPSANYQEVKVKLNGCAEVIDAMERMNDGEEEISNSLGFRFYFYQEFIVVSRKFKGKTSLNILGRRTKKLKKEFGEPEISSDEYQLYKTNYGTLFVRLDAKRRVEEVEMHLTSVKDTWSLVCSDVGMC